ncbi:MAG: hypothetical protein AABY07_05355, partial [Nanoarchaeota archaeon]
MKNLYIIFLLLTILAISFLATHLSRIDFSGFQTRILSEEPIVKDTTEYSYDKDQILDYNKEQTDTPRPANEDRILFLKDLATEEDIEFLMEITP